MLSCQTRSGESGREAHIQVTQPTVNTCSDTALYYNKRLVCPQALLLGDTPCNSKK